MVVSLVVLAGLILTALLVGGAAAVVVVVKVRASLRALIESPAEGELSPLAEITRAIGQDFAKAIILQLKQQIAAPASHMARQENLLRQDFTEAAVADESPQLSALVGLLPKNVQKRVMGNPAAAAALVGLMGRLTGGGSTGDVRENGGGRSSVQSRLKNLSH